MNRIIAYARLDSRIGAAVGKTAVRPMTLSWLKWRNQLEKQVRLHLPEWRQAGADLALSLRMWSRAIWILQRQGPLSWQEMSQVCGHPPEALVDYDSGNPDINPVPGRDAARGLLSLGLKECGAAEVIEDIVGQYWRRLGPGAKRAVYTREPALVRLLFCDRHEDGR